MKLWKEYTALVFISLTINCSPIYGVSYDYNRSLNFTYLMTYDWLPVPKGAIISNLDVERINNAVNNELEAKGLRSTTSNPDFLIAKHLATKDKLRIENFGYYYDDSIFYYGESYRGYGRLRAYQYEEGILILDFVDPKSKKLIWRGSAKGVISDATTPKKRDKLINEAVHKILKNYPPPPEK
jgi:hypothetical protein